MSMIVNLAFVVAKSILFLIVVYINFKNYDRPNDSVHYIAVGNIGYLKNQTATNDVFDNIAEYVGH